jgi:hypothetical protein
LQSTFVLAERITIVLTRIIITLAAMAGFVLGGGAVASASTGAGDNPHQSTPGHFGYIDAVFGPVSCNEVHHPSNNLPGGVPAGATSIGGYDTVQCRFPNPLSAAAGQEFVSGWFSDFGSQFDQNLGLIDVRVDGGGQGYHGVAWYPTG